MIKKLTYKIFGWVVIRPIRKIMGWAVMGSFGLHLKPRRNICGSWDMPNLHYWLVYVTLGHFATWMKWDAWRYFCDWTGGYRRSFPLPARIIHKIGETLSWSFYGGQCYHCASEAGDPVNLTEDETFQLLDSGTSYTPDGTDHWFTGITTCPKCGFKQEYGDSSL